MNLTLPIVLAISGVVLVLIGVIGRIKIKEVDVGTESTPSRIIISLFGVSLLIGAYFVYQTDKPIPPNGNVNTNTRPSPSPTNPVQKSDTVKEDSQPQPQSRFDVASQFTASGSMGDGEKGDRYIKLVEAWKENPHSSPACIKVVYSVGSKGWAGVYWQNKPNNWGDSPGEDFSQASYKTLTFWARGETGDEVVEFKAGGIDAPGKRYKDSFGVSTGKIPLDKEWKQFTLSLDSKKLSSVIGGFCWVASKDVNPKGATFYLDDIFYER